MTTATLRTGAGSIAAYLRGHLFISAILVAVVFGGGYYAYSQVTSTAGETRYVLGMVDRGTVVSTVAASGQVSASNELEIKPKASGAVTAVYRAQGDTVRAGQAIGQIDAKSARQSLLDAESSLTQARLQYQRDSTQAPVDFDKAQSDLDDAKSDLTTTYADTFNTLSSNYLALPTVMTDLNTAINGFDLSPSRSQNNTDVLRNTFEAFGVTKVASFADIAVADYGRGRVAYDKSILAYKTLNRSAQPAELEASLADAIQSATLVAQAIQSELNFLDAVIDSAGQYKIVLSPTVATLRSTAKTDLTTANTNLTALLSQQKMLASNKKAITTAEANIKVLQVGNIGGSNPISLQSSAAAIADKERAIQILKENLADYTIVAPFSGVLASLSLKYGDTVGGASIGTLITKEKIAQLSLNEVDAAKVHLGDKATLTFDAIDGFTLTGKVTQVDTVGTVTQGVVSYSVKVSFDAQDDRIKPGMTVNAAIVTAVKTDVLKVSTSAVKTVNGASSVMVFDPALPITQDTAVSGVVSKTAPKAVTVTTGISDDISIEVVSGLSEGQQVVVRTTTGAVKTTTTGTTNQRGGFGGPGIRL